MKDIENMTSNKMHMHGFTWGKFIAVHQIGNIQVIEYHPYTNFHPQKIGEEILFHPFVCGDSLSVSVGTLEKALITAIAYKAGHMPASEHIFRMLEL